MNYFISFNRIDIWNGRVDLFSFKAHKSVDDGFVRAVTNPC